MQIAQPTGRHRVDFRNFCERVAKSTTFNPQEVAAVLNLATETARDIVANGDIEDTLTYVTYDLVQPKEEKKKEPKKEENQNP